MENIKASKERPQKDKASEMSRRVDEVALQGLIIGLRNSPKIMLGTELILLRI